jgi:hemoglobin-like flavoprotein
MTEETLALFHDSLDRCRRDAGFIDHFYNLFIGSGPDVAAKFADTDFRRQKRVLMASLYALMLAAEGHPEGGVHLRRIATLHDREHHDVRPELYDRWLDALIQAVGDCDPRFSCETEQAWRAIVLPGIGVMKAAYGCPR